MRLLRMAVATGAIIVLSAAPVSAAPATPGDSVGGVGIRLSDNRVQYTVSVKGGPDGTIGSFLFRGLDFKLTFGGRATCFDIDGHQAAIGGVITHSTLPELRGLSYLVFFEDNGPGPDVVSQTYILPGDAGLIDADLSSFPETCPGATVSRADDPYEVQGNFVVSDR